GLPQSYIPAALFFFNVGVELGQLVFVLVVLGLLWILGKIKIDWPDWIKLVTPYVIGSIAAYWLIERLLLFTV
ncbi:MAG: HupE/UreJ family protein, partial [Candidatus Dadabacteria bacterium]|nr:HupE/UreJ family protein [Candidatus Dadabacteria bacterium]